MLWRPSRTMLHIPKDRTVRGPLEHIVDLFSLCDGVSGTPQELTVKSEGETGVNTGQGGHPPCPKARATRRLLAESLRLAIFVRHPMLHHNACSALS